MARSFGFKNERERLVVARREATLLSEAESLLGQIAWEQTENIDELSEEFWQIKEIDSTREKLKEEIRQYEEENSRLQKEHEKLEEEIENEIATLTGRKQAKMQEALKLMHEAEQLRAQAEHTKKKFSGTKTKYKVLSGQGSDREQLNEIVSELHTIKEAYATDKSRVKEITEKIHQIEAEAEQIVTQIEECRSEARKRLSAMMTEVGKSSNKVAQLSATMGSQTRNRKELIYRVGSFLSANTNSKDPEIQKALKHGRGLVARIVTLRRSIAFNKILAGRID